jgi:hypothetical protein
MLEGIIVIFEVALAILHLLQQELFEFDCQVEMTQHIRKRTLEIQDPRLLLKHVYSLPLSLTFLFFPSLDWQSYNCYRKSSSNSVAKSRKSSSSGMTQHIRKRTLEIQDPRLLLKHVYPPPFLPLSLTFLFSSSNSIAKPHKSSSNLIAK